MAPMETSISFLSPEEIVDLRKQHRQERDKRVCDRIKAVLAYNNGHSYERIAEMLLLDESTIRRHIEHYKALKLLNSRSGGSQSKLSQTETAQLIQHLRFNIYLKVKDICAYIKQNYGKIYSVSGMTNWLQQNKFRYKKPHLMPAKADKVKQKEFIATYQRLRDSLPEGEEIYFGDGVHPEHQSKAAYGWIHKGDRKQLPTTGKQHRLHFMGGISITANHRLVYKQYERINSDNIVLFLKALRQQNKQKKTIHFILDNASYHHSKIVKDAAKKWDIKLHYLPPYSPNLNPIERLWKIMHEKVTYNQYYKDFKTFTEKINYFFRHIAKNKILLRSRINDNFHILHSSILAS